MKPTLKGLSRAANHVFLGISALLLRLIISLAELLQGLFFHISNSGEKLFDLIEEEIRKPERKKDGTANT